MSHERRHGLRAPLRASRWSLGWVVALLVSIVLLRSALAAADRNGLRDTSEMNLLLVIIEDCNAGVWSSYGNSICKTPNMDRFATTAVQFNAAYVQAVACNPSRSSFLTGLRPLTSGVWNNSQVMRERLPAGTQTLPRLLKQHGLHTAVIGKFFHRQEHGGPEMLVFDRIEHNPTPPNWQGAPPILTFPPIAADESNPAPADINSAEYRTWKNRRSSRYGDSGAKLENEGDYRIAQTAVALLEEFAKTKQRFFLSVHQARPHTPLLAPKKYIDMYDAAEIPPPPAPPAGLKDFPYMARATGNNPDLFNEGQPTPQQASEAIAAYYACVSFVDDNVGRILAALDEQGLADNTIVVVMGDHGFHLGDHGMWSKYSMLEATRRAPLWVRVPGAPSNGKVCREFVEFVDLIPTLSELLGFEAPSNLEGTSFVPLLVTHDLPWKSAVFQVQSPNEQMVRDRRYSYLEFKGGRVPVALYDLENDPWETVNLANDPAHAEIRSEMSALLQSGWKAARPKLAEPRREADTAKATRERPFDKAVVFKNTPQGELKAHINFPPGWSAADRRPAIVFWVGGGFKSGAVGQFNERAKYFAGRGLVTICAEYRGRVSHGILLDSCAEDARSAMRWVKGHASELGIAPDKVIASGGSAGGCLSLLVARENGPDAKSDNLDISTRPSALVLFNPAVGEGVMQTIGWGGAAQAGVNAQVAALDTPQQQEPPVIMFFGTEDRFLKVAREFDRKAQAQGSRCEVWVADKMKHGFFNDQPWHDATTRLADEFLTSLGYLKGAPTIAENPAAVLTLDKTR